MRMLCKKCGKDIIPNSKFCNYCGAMVEATVETPKDNSLNYGYMRPTFDDISKNHSTNGLAIAGFSCAIAPIVMPVFSLFIPHWPLLVGALACLTGLVLSILGLSRSKVLPNRSGRGLAVAGIVISSVQIALTILSVILIAWLLAGIGSMIGNSLWGVGKMIESVISGYTDAINAFSDVFDKAFSSIP